MRPAVDPSLRSPGLPSFPLRTYERTSREVVQALSRVNVRACAYVPVVTILHASVKTCEPGGNTSPRTYTPVSTIAKGPWDHASTRLTARNFCKRALTLIKNALRPRCDSLSALTPPNGPVKGGQRGAIVATILPTHFGRVGVRENGAGVQND